MNYLLDSNACLALIHDKPYVVRTHLHRALQGGSSVSTSSLVIFDLWKRVAESPRAQKQIMETFLAGPLNVLPFDENDAVAAAELRKEMGTLEMKITDLEIEVSGQARARRLTLVTAGAKLPEFKSLAWRDWSR